MDFKTQLEAMYTWETQRPDEIWLTQPMGGGKVVDLTYGQAMDQVRRMAAHLASLDLPERSQIALFSKNTAWWLLADLAIWMAGHVSVPLYPTLTPETIGQILDHSESRLVFIGKLDGFEQMAPGIPDSLPRIQLPLAPSSVDAPSWDEIIEQTEPMADSPKPEPDRLATIIYTSGSTGVPKGVMHSFATMCASSGFIKMMKMSPEDRILSYLPLAHAMERTAVETMSFLVGFHVFFAESLDTFVEDIRRARPTLFISVPRLWIKFQAGVFKKMPPAKLGRLLKIPVVRGIVRKKILSGLGLEHVRYAFSGSAPIPGELIDWYRSLGLELLEGYGMSENFSYSHITRPGESKVGYVGRPVEGAECKLSDEGEILVRSPATMLGYFKAPDLTAEVMTDDGYLRTGDRGEIDGAGALKITGRVKELFKTSKGKYVSPAPIENKLINHPLVEQACVTGANMPTPFALVVLSPDLDLSTSSVKEKVVAELEQHLEEINRTLDHHENLHTLVISSDEWTVENSMLTPTMKLRRGNVEDRYADRVEGWYETRKKVIWA